MTIIRYTGPHDAADIPTPAGTITLERDGAAAEVPDAIAAALVAQGGFESADSPTQPRRRPAPAATAPQGD